MNTTDAVDMSKATLCIGTKVVELFPMNRGEYNQYRGWQIPENEDPSDEGYLVEYRDGGKPNDPRHKGYISWSPKSVADHSYKPADTPHTFLTAMTFMDVGVKVRRTSWPEGVWIRIINPNAPRPDDPSQVSAVNPPFNPYFRVSENNPEEVGKLLPWFVKNDVNNHLVPWSASYQDVMAQDWVVVSKTSGYTGPLTE